jgi:hypothetical protein
MPLLIKDIQTPEQLTNYIDGCLNDFETGISTKEETSYFMHKLISTIARACAEKTTIAEAREILDAEEADQKVSENIRNQVVNGG